MTRQERTIIRNALIAREHAEQTGNRAQLERAIHDIETTFQAVNARGGLCIKNVSHLLFEER